MLGFTPKESKFIIFLLLTFLAGLCIRIFQIKWKSLPETPSLVMNNDVTVNDETVTEKDNQVTCVNINKANLDDFKTLPGIGPVKAERIVQYRKTKGYFTSINELKNVKGIGEKTIEQLKPFLKINLINTNITMEENR